VFFLFMQPGFGWQSLLNPERVYRHVPIGGHMRKNFIGFLREIFHTEQVSVLKPFTRTLDDIFLWGAARNDASVGTLAFSSSTTFGVTIVPVFAPK
jgi:hypothetical protein